MATLTDSQIAGAAKSAGFSGKALAVAVAVALAESGGRSDAHNKIPPDDSYGLWQINMLGSMGPARRKQFGLSSNAQLFDPATNAKAAYAISSKGTNFRPWTTYSSGSYLRYMSRANKAAGNPSASVPGSDVSQAGFLDSLNPLTEITDFFDFITDPKTWLRLGMILAGAALLVTALVQISGAGGKAKQIADAVTNVMPQTKAVKATAKVAG